MNKKKQETYNLKQIIQVVKDIYKIDAWEDSWGVPVIYKESFISHLQERLKKIKQFVK